jgi:hypothetical protein
MTTKVIIKSPPNNHQAVLVRVTNPINGAQYQEHHLEDDQQVEVYVHSGAKLDIYETPKKPKAD